MKTIHAYKKGIRYSQTNNIIERFLYDLRIDKKISFHLESCNVSSLCCGIEAVGGSFKFRIPVVAGSPLYGQDDFAFNYLYSTYGQNNAPFVRAGICENEVIENLAWLVNEISDCKGAVIPARDTKHLIEIIDASLAKGHSVVLSYLTDYENYHYITVVAKENGVYKCYDSWEGNKHCKNGGTLEEYPESFFLQRCKNRLRILEIRRL